MGNVIRIQQKVHQEIYILPTSTIPRRILHVTNTKDTPRETQRVPREQISKMCHFTISGKFNEKRNIEVIHLCVE